MRNIYLKTLCLLFLFCMPFVYAKEVKKIAIILPMEHKAMVEIVDGFKEELIKRMPIDKYELSIFNAQGDQNLSKIIFQQIASQNFDIIVPIGTTITQFAIKKFQKDKQIISIAAEIDANEIKSSENLYVINDVVSMESFVKFIKSSLGTMQNLTVIRSNEPRIYNQTQDLEKVLKKYGVSLQVLEIHNMSELYSSIKSIKKDSQGIIVLKDHLVVSGISSIVKEAKKLDIPTICSDEGSVFSGCDIALGVKEKDMGVAAGKIAFYMLEKKQINKEEILDLDTIVFFRKNFKSKIAFDSSVKTMLIN
ncbi:MAG: putative ABC transport system substrate-binding protein [Candidatus Midichloriaceae bacterium]|jgi:putative ABC transport system substrate-binding protein